MGDWLMTNDVLDHPHRYVFLIYIDFSAIGTFRRL